MPLLHRGDCSSECPRLCLCLQVVRGAGTVGEDLQRCDHLRAKQSCTHHVRTCNPAIDEQATGEQATGEQAPGEQTTGEQATVEQATSEQANAAVAVTAAAAGAAAGAATCATASAAATSSSELPPESYAESYAAPLSSGGVASGGVGVFWRPASTFCLLRAAPPDGLGPLYDGFCWPSLVYLLRTPLLARFHSLMACTQ